MQMPMLRPIPIVTKGFPFWRKLLALLTTAREWEFAADWVFVLPCGTPILIKAGFRTDGVSAPKFLWGLMDSMGIFLIPGIIHDHGYRFNYLWAIGPDGCLYKYHIDCGRAFWDDLFLEIGFCLTDLKITGYISYWMLRLLGRFAWNKNRILNQPDMVD